MGHKVKIFFLMAFLNVAYSQPLIPLPSQVKFVFLFILFLFTFGIIYFFLGKILQDKGKDNLIRLVLSLTSAFLLIFMVINSPFGIYFIEVILPFILFTVFLLALIYVFFSALGIKFGSGENEEGFINIVSPIVMWVAAGILLIAFLASLKKMGYSIINKMLQPTMLGILVFFLILGFIVMTLED